MAIEFRCGNCSSRLKAPDNSSGKRVKCPKCASVQTIPAAKPPADDELTLMPVADPPSPSPTPKIAVPAPKPALAAKPKTAPVQSKVKTPPLAPLESPSPFGMLGALSEGDLAAGVPIQSEKPAWQTAAPVPEFESLDYSPLAPGKGGSSGSLVFLKIPAVMLMGLSLFTAVAFFIGIVASFMALTNAKVQVERIFESYEATGVVVGIIVFFIMGFVAQIGIFRAAFYMLLEKKHASAKIGAILASIPLCSPLGFPFGIWALMMLCEKSVKNKFQD
jgi:hypothetical protein